MTHNSNEFARLLEVRRETPYKLQNPIGLLTDAAAVSTSVHTCLVVGRRDSVLRDASDRMELLGAAALPSDSLNEADSRMPPTGRSRIGQPRTLTFAKVEIILAEHARFLEWPGPASDREVTAAAGTGVRGLAGDHQSRGSIEGTVQATLPGEPCGNPRRVQSSTSLSALSKRAAVNPPLTNHILVITLPLACHCRTRN
jgi:hypothetical protein